MLYLKNNTERQTVMLPRHSDVNGEGGWLLTFEQTAAGVRQRVVNMNVREGRNYVEATFRLPDLIGVGEFVYTLTHGGVVMSRGLAVVGDYHTERVTFKDKYTVKQYGQND